MTGRELFQASEIERQEIAAFGSRERMQLVEDDRVEVGCGKLSALDRVERRGGCHLVEEAGVLVEERFDLGGEDALVVAAGLVPLDRRGAAAFENVLCAGSVIEGWDPARDGAAGGVSVLTGLLAGEGAALLAGLAAGTLAIE